MRIAEVVERYGVSADTLRYYERVGLLRHVSRTASGIRDYSEDDCARLAFVKCLRGANVSIEALAEYMRLLDQGDDTLETRKVILVEEREKAAARLDQMQAALERLDYKIAHYDELIAKAGLEGHRTASSRNTEGAASATQERNTHE